MNDTRRSRRYMQGAAALFMLVIGARHLMPDSNSTAGGFDAFCPFGAVESAWSFLTTGEMLRTTNALNITMFVAVIAVSVFAGRAFCGWMCPMGALQDGSAWLARRITGGKGKRKGFLPLRVPEKLDKFLRYFKYLLLIWIVLESVNAVYPPVHEFCPVRATYGFAWYSPLLVLVLIGFIGSSMLVERFSCKYICPLGAILGIFNRIAPLRPIVNKGSCVDCGNCTRHCPMGIPDVPDQLNSAECTRCLECLESCGRKNTMLLWLGKTKSVEQ